jgi:hypothetical protein
MKKIIPLLFSDRTFGTEEFGFIERQDLDGDDEDARYERFVKDNIRTNDKFRTARSVRVVEGQLILGIDR